MKKIKVTQDHIDWATGHRADPTRTYESPCHCPIALALRGVGFQKVAVDEDQVYMGETCETYSLSPAAQRFIRHFDNGESVTPFNFILPTSPVSHYIERN